MAKRNKIVPLSSASKDDGDENDDDDEEIEDGEAVEQEAEQTQLNALSALSDDELRNSYHTAYDDKSYRKVSFKR